MDSTIKITKRNYYQALIRLVETGTLTFDTQDGPVEITGEQLIDFANTEIAALDHKAEKSRERAAIKRTQNDELTELVYAAVTDKFRCIADIAADVESDDVSVNKVGNRLTRLLKEGRIVQSKINAPLVEGGKTRMVAAYALPPEEQE